MPKEALVALRDELASWPADASTDAHGIEAPQKEQLYAPAAHAAALDPRSVLVHGSRGTGKSFWSGVLADARLRAEAAKAYPRLGLENIEVEFGFTGLPAPIGLDRDLVDDCVPDGATDRDARAFWWATVLRALEQTTAGPAPGVRELLPVAADAAQRQERLASGGMRLMERERRLVIVYDALDAVATTWPRRTLLTESLLEVVWALRAYPAVRPKVFLRPDQLEDEGLRFVELPKMRAGAVRLCWDETDLYALLFARLALGSAADAFAAVLDAVGEPRPTSSEILTRQWRPALGGGLARGRRANDSVQRRLMTVLAGDYMAEGPNGHKKGKTYDWPPKHLADAFGEVTPRSFIALMIGAAKYGPTPEGRVVTPDGIQHGLRMASKMRVDQLHLEFPWIKAVLAPLAGLLLPANEEVIFKAWRDTTTVETIRRDATRERYLPPFRSENEVGELDLFVALQGIGVMNRRADGRLDMPDLFRVAARLLKRGGTAPVQASVARDGPSR